MIRLVVACLIIVAVAAVFPTPLLHSTFQGELLLETPCHLYQVDHPILSSGAYYLDKIMERINKGKRCEMDKTLFSQNQWKNLIKINIRIPTQHEDNSEKDIEINTNPNENNPNRNSNSMKSQGYELQVNQQGITISCIDYKGYVYALETLSQLITPALKIPFTFIRDEPAVSYRGIMIDSVRHFLPVSSIKLLISSMPLSKLNILHWHLSDDQAFPLRVGSHPELAEYSVYSSDQSYSLQDIRDIIEHARKNGVDIVPEVDTPAHVRAWGLAKQWADKQIVIQCPKGQGYNGQFDLSKADTFTLAMDIVKEFDVLFRDSPYIHLGGDQVSSGCWDLRPEIKTFMKLKNIGSYGQLQMYWRYQLKQVLAKDRKVMFWRNDGVNVTTADNDILHYWGAQADTAKIVGTSKSKIVLSPSDHLYLNKGHGNIWLNATAGDYSTWLQIYHSFVLFPTGVDRTRILGAEVCLWGEVSNADTLENNLWMRATSFAARVWSEQKLSTAQLVFGIVGIQRSLYQMGVAASPITSEFCQYKPQVCFPSSSSSQQLLIE